MKTLAVIYNHNFPEITDNLWESLEPHKRDDYDIILIDNGSTPEGKSKYTTHETGQNTYFGGALNIAIQFFLDSGKYDSLLSLNNDLILQGPNFIKTLKAGGPTSFGIPGNLNQLINAFTSQTGPFAGFKQTIAGFFEQDKFRYGGEKNNYYQKKLQKRLEDAEDALKSTSRAAQYRGYIEFMKFQLAYQMASALQGGTGGRTISDQDVENMMASMNFGSKDDIKHVIGSLERLSNIMGELHLVNSYYAESPQHAGAARLYEMVNASGGSPFTTEAVLNLISKATDKNIKDRAIRKGTTPIFKDGKLIGYR